MPNVLMYFEEQEKVFRDKINRGIQENRKGTAIIRLKDENGKDIENARVKIEQKTHDFKFGCNIFMLDGFEDETATRQYKDRFKDIFNLAVVPFYWGDLEPVEGKPRFSKASEKIYRRPAPDLVLEFCRENHIEPKGHTLMWHSILPQWLKRDGESVKAQIDKRLREISERYSSEISTWDVVNEALASYNEQNYIFPKDYVYWTFHQAEKYFKCNRMFINEVTDLSWNKAGEFSAYSLLIENLLLKGVNLGGIGLQYHMFVKKEELAQQAEQFFNPNVLFKVLDNYHKFNLPVHVSEITIPSYETSEESERLQAELVKNLYRLWFSHPAIESIIWWNLIDGYAYVREGWNEDYYGGGLLNKDFTPKAAYKVLQELIHNEWHTSLDIENADSRTVFDGFYGEYEITAVCQNKVTTSKIHLSKTGLKEYEIVI